MFGMCAATVAAVSVCVVSPVVRLVVTLRACRAQQLTRGCARNPGSRVRVGVCIEGIVRPEPKLNTLIWVLKNTIVYHMISHA
eukprot:4451594-Prymnesium_polylepis.1